MTELKSVVAKNIATLRVSQHLTQFELGEKLSYSDKAVSRWERGEAIPDAYVLLQMSEIFGVTVDFILREHTEEEFLPLPEDTPEETPLHKKTDKRLVTILSFLAVWALSLVAFVICAIADAYVWQVFIYAIPVSFTVLLIFNCIWGKRLWSAIYLSIAVWGLLASIHLSCLAYDNSWMLYLLGVPAQIIIPIAFSIGRKNRKS